MTNIYFLFFYYFKFLFFSIHQANSKNIANATHRIVGGNVECSTNEISKYVVSLRVKNLGSVYGSNHYCGGTIISKTTILTAAHCLLMWGIGV